MIPFSVGSSLGLAVREALPEDLKFIVSSWFASQREQFMDNKIENPFPHLEKAIKQARVDNNLQLLKTIFQREMKLKIANGLFQIKPIVVFDTQYPGVIVAWVCANQQTAHYVYTKQSFRRLGIAMNLLRMVASKSSTKKGSSHAGDFLWSKFTKLKEIANAPRSIR